VGAAAVRGAVVVVRVGGAALWVGLGAVTVICGMFVSVPVGGAAVCGAGVCGGVACGVSGAAGGGVALSGARGGGVAGC
jgi:hypothetical protein